MFDLDKIKSERKSILDLLFLITALGLIINLFTDLLLNSCTTFQLIVVIIALFFILWRVIASPLFSLKSTNIISLGLVFDSKNQEILFFNQFDKLIFHLSNAFDKLKTRDDDFKQKKHEWVVNDKLFSNKILDLIEYSILVSISEIYNGGWKLKYRIRSFDTESWSYEKLKMTEIKFKDLPENLISHNTFFKLFKDSFTENSNVILFPLEFALPPKTKIFYEFSNNNRTLTFKNLFLQFNINIRFSSARVGAPEMILGTFEEKQKRYVTFIYYVELKIKLNPYLSLLPQAEKYSEWAEDFANYLINLIEYEEDVKNQ